MRARLTSLWSIAGRRRPRIGPWAHCVFTAIEVLAGNANVDVGASMMRVQVDTTLWPAWVGLALAGVMAAAAAIPYLASSGERTPTTVAPHGRS